MNSLLEKTEQYVTDLLSHKLKGVFVYHDLDHTKRVVEKVKELAELSELSDKKKTILMIAAWFHDTGFLNTIHEHEEESVNIARKFLEQYNLDKNDIATITGLIRATKLDKAPETELERYIKDADCAYVSSENYEDYAQLLKQEWESTSNKKFTKDEWMKNNLDFITNHQFYSKIAVENWNKEKENNVRLLKTKINGLPPHK